MGVQNGAALLVLVAAIPEVASPKQRCEFNKALGDSRSGQVPQMKFPDPRGVDQLSSPGQVVQGCRCRCVFADPRRVGQVANADFPVRQQALDQG